MRRALLACRATILALLTVLLAALGAHGQTAGTDSTVADLFQSSYALEARRDYRGALAKAQTVLEREPDDYVAQLRIGWLLYLNSRYAESSAAYRKAVRLAPEAVEPRLGLMLPLMAARQHQEALTAADSVLELDPGNLTARSRKAYTLYLLGRYTKAETQYREVLKRYPSNVDMMSGLGWTLLKRGQRAQAQAVFEKLLRVSPTHSLGRSGLAECRQP